MTETLDLVIAGAAGSGLKVLQILEDRRDAGDRSLNLIGFIDDDPNLHGQDFFDYPVFGDDGALPTIKRSGPLGVVCAIGDPVARYRMIQRLRRHEVAFPIAVHPSAQVSARARLGQGNVLSQNVVLQAAVTVGDFNSFNIGAVAGPLATIGDFCTVNALVMVASGAVVENFCYIGMGAKIKQRIRLGTGTTVGANAFVGRDTDEWTTMVGLPARVARRRADPFTEAA